MNILVVGAGIYGITTAIKLAKYGNKVDLVEKNSDILSSASGINQFRIHKGYHYPRSIDTIKSSLDSLPAFEAEYGEAIIRKFKHYYCISKENSKTNREDFIHICKENKLPFKEVDLDFIKEGSVSLSIEADEDLLDPVKLKEICYKKIKNSNVNLVLNKKVTNKDFDNYDFVVLCVYASYNSLLSGIGHKRTNYQFEICEKVVVQLPEEFSGESIVILDGPFMCLDPYGQSGNFLMGNVVHAVHHSNVGLKPEIPLEYVNLLNKGVINNPSVTNFNNFIKSAIKFMPKIKDAKHIGSMFTVRVILPRELNITDNRPIYVKKVNKKVISVFSAKLSNCVQVADKVSNIIKESSK